MPPWASRILLSSWFTIPPYYDQLSLSVICICRQRAIRRALKTQRSSSAIAPHLQQNDDHSADEPFHCPGYVLTTVVFFTGGATISGVGEARQNIDIPLDTLTRRAFFDGLFACVQEAIVLLDTGDRILLVNPEFSRVFGYAQEEACGHLIQELIVPEELLTEVEEYARRALREESLNYEAVRKRKDGTCVHVSVISGPVSVAGGHISHYAIYRDVTERKRAEQRLRESEAYLAEAQRLSQTGSWAWNPATGDVRYCSEMCCHVLGFDHAGPPPRFEEFFQRLHPDDRAASRERFEKGIRDKADFEWDYRIVHPQKGIRDIHAVGRAVLDGSSNLAEFVGTVMDVTERKRREQELRQSEVELRTITDTIRQPIGVEAPDGTQLYANRVALDNSGLTLDEVIKEGTIRRENGFLARRCHPDDINRVRD